MKYIIQLDKDKRYINVSPIRVIIELQSNCICIYKELYWKNVWSIGGEIKIPINNFIAFADVVSKLKKIIPIL